MSFFDPDHFVLTHASIFINPRKPSHILTHPTLEAALPRLFSRLCPNNDSDYIYDHKT